MLLWKCCAALPDESRLAIVIDEDMETDSSENSRDSDMDTSLSASPSPAPSTSVINNKLSASNHLTNHNHNNAVLGSGVVSSNGETDSVDVYNNVLAGGAFRGNSRPGSSSNNNRNNKESWNFNCRLRVKICKEVKKPGRGEWQTGCVGDCLVIDKLLVGGGIIWLFTNYKISEENWKRKEMLRGSQMSSASFVHTHLGVTVQLIKIWLPINPLAADRNWHLGLFENWHLGLFGVSNHSCLWALQPD